MKMINVTQKFRACFCSLLVGAALISPASWAAQTLQQASVTEAVNSVSYQTDKSAPQKPASPGTIIHSDNVVRTGIKSRAELQFNHPTVTRIAANPAFPFS